MEHDHAEYGQGAAKRGKWVLTGFIGVAVFFLLTEHRAHLLGILPYLVFLACPLMHLFHHHGHGRHHHGGNPSSDPTGQPKSEGRGQP